jgi:hypothetical protein
MKNLLKIALMAAGVFAFTSSYANTVTRDTTNMGHKMKRTAKKVGHETGETAEKVGNATARTAKKVGHKTAEVAAKGAAAITDKKYEGKCGPMGETVYINEDSKYFYVNKTGHRVYLKKSQLKNSADMKM